MLQYLYAYQMFGNKSNLAGGTFFKLISKLLKSSIFMEIRLKRVEKTKKVHFYGTRGLTLCRLTGLSSPTKKKKKKIII